MAIKCTTEKELSKAIKDKQDEIIIEGDLKNHVIRIKATGPVAWGVCAASLAIAITALMTAPAASVVATPVGGVVHFLGGVTMSAAAAAPLGSALVPAVLIGIAGGGIGALNMLRDRYKIVEKNKNYLKLKRK